MRPSEKSHFPSFVYRQDGHELSYEVTKRVYSILGNLSSTHYAQNRPKSCATLPVRLKIGEPLQNRTRHVGEALSLPLARSALGSLSEGAAERSEAEGVYPVGCCKPMVSPAPLQGRFKIGEPLQNRTRHVGEALSLPKLTQQSGSLNIERLRRWRAASSRPYWCSGNRGSWRAARLASPTGRVRLSGCSLKSVGAGGFEPPLPVRWKP